MSSSPSTSRRSLPTIYMRLQLTLYEKLCDTHTTLHPAPTGCPIRPGEVEVISRRWCLLGSYTTRRKGEGTRVLTTTPSRFSYRRKWLLGATHPQGAEIVQR